ncbi:unnamed protein product [Nesidiocoris tenuis]|uniref:Uncharacterized protein n=1 Tax=Nesidiocoris tenuis TaxID=355587 RepID=A0A6H5G6R9_9HEMI|nr:unnamed protein product [Nesidiocoris tenuis]
MGRKWKMRRREEDGDEEEEGGEPEKEDDEGEEVGMGRKMRRREEEQDQEDGEEKGDREAEKENDEGEGVRMEEEEEEEEGRRRRRTTRGKGRYCGYWTILQVYCPGGPNKNSRNNLLESVSESNPNEIRPVRDNCLGILKRGGLTGARVIGFLPISGNGSFVFAGPSGETTATNQYRPKKVEIFFDPFSGNRSPAIGRSADRERFRPITEERTNSFVFARAKRAG